MRKQKPSVGRKKIPADYQQLAKDQVLPSGASNSNTFVEEFLPEGMEYSHHKISAREALDKKLITHSQLKVIHKNVGHYMHDHGDVKFSFHKEPFINHIHIDNDHYHIQTGVSRKGQHYYHAVFRKEHAPDYPGGTRFHKVHSKGLDNDN